MRGLFILALSLSSAISHVKRQPQKINISFDLGDYMWFQLEFKDCPMLSFVINI